MSRFSPSTRIKTNATLLGCLMAPFIFCQVLLSLLIPVAILAILYAVLHLLYTGELPIL